MNEVSLYCNYQSYRFGLIYDKTASRLELAKKIVDWMRCTTLSTPDQVKWNRPNVEHYIKIELKSLNASQTESSKLSIETDKDIIFFFGQKYPEGTTFECDVNFNHVRDYIKGEYCHIFVKAVELCCEVYSANEQAHDSTYCKLKHENGFSGYVLRSDGYLEDSEDMRILTGYEKYLNKDNNVCTRLFVCIRGTETTKNWWYNISFRNTPFYTKGHVHSGFFALAKNVVSKQILDLIIHGNTTKAMKIDQVVVCGHSLGGAIASLITAGVLVEAELANIKLTSEQLKCVTIGAPPCGSQTFVDFLNQIHGSSDLAQSFFYHIVQDDDLVPKTMILLTLMKGGSIVSKPEHKEEQSDVDLNSFEPSKIRPKKKAVVYSRNALRHGLFALTRSFSDYVSFGTVIIFGGDSNPKFFSGDPRTYEIYEERQLLYDDLSGNPSSISMHNTKEYLNTVRRYFLGTTELEVSKEIDKDDKDFLEEILLRILGIHFPNSTENDLRAPRVNELLGCYFLRILRYLSISTHPMNDLSVLQRLVHGDKNIDLFSNIFDSGIMNGFPFLGSSSPRLNYIKTCWRAATMMCKIPEYKDILNNVWWEKMKSYNLYKFSDNKTYYINSEWIALRVAVLRDSYADTMPQDPLFKNLKIFCNNIVSDRTSSVNLNSGNNIPEVLTGKLVKGKPEIYYYFQEKRRAVKLSLGKLTYSTRKCNLDDNPSMGIHTIKGLTIKEVSLKYCEITSKTKLRIDISVNDTSRNEKSNFYFLFNDFKEQSKWYEAFKLHKIYDQNSVRNI